MMISTLPVGSAGRMVVTGATGFLGRNIVERALVGGYEVVPITQKMTDVRKTRAFADFLHRVSPDFAIDAAGVRPGTGNVAVNVALTQAWLEVLACLDRPPRLVLIGSAGIFGAGASPDRATTEDDPHLPISDYGRAKLQALELAREAYLRDGQDVQIGILFNLMGRGQPSNLAPQVFINQALDAPDRPITAGAVDSVRDFLDVADAADALIAMALLGKPGDVMNVASGEPTRIRDILDTLTKLLGVLWTTSTDENASAKVDICYGDATRLRSRTGWYPKFDVTTALRRAIDASIETRKQRKEKT